MIPLLLEAALRAATLGLLLWAVLKGLSVRDVHVEKFLWTLWAAASLAMPALMHTASLAVPTPTSISITGANLAARVFVRSDHAAIATAALDIYLVVASVLLLRFFVRLYGASRLYRQARPPAAALVAGGELRIRISHAVRAPCTFAGGILLPVGFESWGATARAAALAHERSHVIHRDCWRLWLATVNSCVFWFNPAAWLVRRRLQLLAELSSDQDAVRCVEDPAAYAEMLVQLAAQGSPVAAATAMSGAAHLTARINRIMDKRMISAHLSRDRTVTLAGASFLAAVVCCSCASGPHVLTPTEERKVSWISGAPLAEFYPAALRHNNVEGYVVMKLAIDRTGRVTAADVVKETPAGSGLGLAAVNATRTFQFNNTLAEPVIKTMQVRFALVE
jgi:TonB family protein